MREQVFKCTRVLGRSHHSQMGTGPSREHPFTMNLGLLLDKTQGLVLEELLRKTNYRVWSL